MKPFIDILPAVSLLILTAITFVFFNVSISFVRFSAFGTLTKDNFKDCGEDSKITPFVIALEALPENTAILPTMLVFESERVTVSTSPTTKLEYIRVSTPEEYVIFVAKALLAFEALKPICKLEGIFTLTDLTILSPLPPFESINLIEGLGLE